MRVHTRCRRLAEIDITISVSGWVPSSSLTPVLSLAYSGLRAMSKIPSADTKFEIRERTTAHKRKAKGTRGERVRKVERNPISCNVFPTFLLFSLSAPLSPTLSRSGSGHRAILRQCTTARAKSRGWGRTAHVSGYVVTCTYRGESVFNYGYVMPGGDCRPMCAHMSAPQVALVRRWLARRVN